MLAETQQLLDEISQQEESSSFVLVGGTALSLHANHRLSEDLDFATTQDKLDRAVVQRILDKLSKNHSLANTVSIGDVDRYANEGLDILDFQQNWLVDKVRVTFFSIGDTKEERAAIAAAETVPYNKTRVLGLDGLFLTKCLAFVQRLKSRDLFDLCWFVTERHYGIDELFSTIQAHHPNLSYEMLRYRLLDQALPMTDEGFVSVVNGKELLSDETTIEDVRNVLREQVNAWEISQVASLATRMKNNP